MSADLLFVTEAISGNMKQYPHLLYGVSLPVDSTRDENGNYVAQIATNPLISNCREETNGQGREIQAADGKFHKYSSVIYLPLSCPDVEFGREVFVRDSSSATTDRIKGMVLNFDRSQMHCRLWV